MTPRKTSASPKGLLSRLRAFVDALSERYQRALQVVDEALDSDNLKEKMWAVNLILKAVPPVKGEESGKKSAHAHNKDEAAGEAPEDAEDDTDPERLDEGELIQRIRRYLRDPEA